MPLVVQPQNDESAAPRRIPPWGAERHLDRLAHTLKNDLLVDATPAHLVLAAVFGFDGAGRVTSALDLEQPSIAGTSLFVQFLSLDGVPLASNGLEFRFTD